MATTRTYRFETLLRLRQVREDEQKRIVASRLEAIETLRRRQRDLEAQVTDQAVQMRRDLTAPQSDIDVLRWSRHWIGRLRRGILETEAEIAAQRAQLAQERAGLVEARKEREILERLKRRQRVAYLAEQAVREQRELDDLNLTRHIRSMQRAEDARP